MILSSFIVFGFLGVSVPSFRLWALILLLLFSCLFLIDIEKALILLLIIRGSLDLFHTEALFHFGSRHINLAGVLSVAVVGLGLAYLIVKRIRFLRIPLACPYIVFGILCLFSLLFAPDKISGLEDMLRLSSILILFMLVSTVMKTKKQIMNIANFLLLALPVPLGMGIYQVWAKDYWVNPRGYDTFGRILGSFVHPNVFGLFLMIFIGVVVFHLLTCRSVFKKVVLSGLLLIMFFTLFHTYSRVAWIGTLIVFIMLGIIRYRKLLILIPGVILLMFLFIPSLSERLIELPMTMKNFKVNTPSFRPSHPSVKDASFQWRLWFWNKALEKALSDKTLFLHGYGIGNFQKFSEDYASNPITKTGKEAHNDYVRLLIEIGAIGLLIYLWILYRIFRIGVCAYRQTDDMYLKYFVLTCLSLSVAYVIASLSGNLVTTPVLQWYFWSLMALMCSIRMRKGKRITEGDQRVV